MAWRENKEQAVELRDLKKQHAHLKETMRTQGDSRSFRDQIMSERRKFYEHVDMLDDHIAHLKHQLEKTKLHMDQLTFQTREANEDKAAYESKLQTLQKQNNRLNEDLTECRDDILRLQPPSQIPDSKIAEEYTNLYQQIASWVDDEAEDSSAMEDQLAKLLADKDAPELLKSILDNDLIRATKKYPDAEPLILRYIISTHIHRCILADDIYLFGLDDHNVTVLRSIAHAMEDLEPKRGKPLLSPTIISMINISTLTNIVIYRLPHHPTLALRNPPSPRKNRRLPHRTASPRHHRLQSPPRRPNLPPPRPHHHPRPRTRLATPPQHHHSPGRAPRNKHALLHLPLPHHHPPPLFLPQQLRQ